MVSAEYYFAPMEGVAGAVFRLVHHKYFPGADRYYMPFLSPASSRVFSPRDLREISPEANQGIPAVPQLLTKSPEDFLWAAEELCGMGYREVNLNLGCPSGTVTAKGKGAGMLRDPDALDRFLEAVFARAPCPVSIKTRLGMRDPGEFPRLLEIFRRYPVSLLIIHPRVREDFYRRPVREDAFAEALALYPGPVCYNGGLTSVSGVRQFQERFPGVKRLMIGRGALADPALFTRIRGGPAADWETLRSFHDELCKGYRERFGSERAVLCRMKELWGYLALLFEGSGRPLRRLRKASSWNEYESAAEALFALPILPEPAW